MTLAVLRTFVETDLLDAGLQVILDAADEDLTLAVGPETAAVQTYDAEGDRFLFLGRPASVVASITETVGATVTTLATNDWKLWSNATQLERLSTGTHPAGGWCGQVDVTYTPDDLNRRNRALTQLVQLAVDFRPGGKSESIGDHNRTQDDYDVARNRILMGARSRTFA